jgi:hypothetical protein
MHPLLRKMPPLALAATECRLEGRGAAVKRETNDPATGRPCSVRLHGDLVVTYMLRTVGGPCSKIPRVVRKDLPWRFDKVFYLDDPDAFFRSYTACSVTLEKMFAQTPVVGEFDVAADNWDDGFPPHELAAKITSAFRRDAVYNMGVAPLCNIDVSLDVWVEAVYSEPRALLLACKQTTAAIAEAAGWVTGGATADGAAECCVCMDGLAAPKDGSSDTVMLPCSHVFHSSCLLPWFHRVSTCPMCRRDMAIPTFIFTLGSFSPGKFPGLET